MTWVRSNLARWIEIEWLGFDRAGWRQSCVADGGVSRWRFAGVGQKWPSELGFGSGLVEEQEREAANSSRGSARGEDAMEDVPGGEEWNGADGEQSSTRGSER